MTTVQTIEVGPFQNATVESLDIAGYTTSEIAREWLSSFRSYLSETIKYHSAGDEDFIEDIKDGVPAEMLNSAEQDAWSLLRTEYGAFGLDEEAEEVINDFITTWREDGTLTQAITQAIEAAA